MILAKAVGKTIQLYTPQRDPHLGNDGIIHYYYLTIEEAPELIKRIQRELPAALMVQKREDAAALTYVEKDLIEAQKKVQWLRKRVKQLGG